MAKLALSKNGSAAQAAEASRARFEAWDGAVRAAINASPEVPFSKKIQALVLIVDEGRATLIAAGVMAEVEQRAKERLLSGDDTPAP